MLLPRARRPGEHRHAVAGVTHLEQDHGGRQLILTRNCPHAVPRAARTAFEASSVTNRPASSAVTPQPASARAVNCRAAGTQRSSAANAYWVT